MVTEVARPPSIPVHFTEGMVCPLERDDFLANKTNKQQLINQLSNHFGPHCTEVLHAEAEEGVFRIQTTNKSADSMTLTY